MRYLILLLILIGCTSEDIEITDAGTKDFVFIDLEIPPIKEITTINIYGSLCQPCNSNVDCSDSRGLCVYNLILDESFCSMNCAKVKCPANFFCIPPLIGHEEIEMIRQCLPIDSTITCKDNLYNN